MGDQLSVPELPRVTGEVYTSHQYPLDSCPRQGMHRLEDCTAEVAATLDEQFAAFVSESERQIQKTVESERLTAEDFGTRINCVPE